MNFTGLIRGSVMVIFYLSAFISTAWLLPKRYHKNSFSNLCLLGFMMYFSFFQVVALPMKLLKMPLKYLSIIWLIFLGCIFLFVVIKRRNEIIIAVKGAFLSKEKLLCGLLFLILTIFIALLLGFNTNHISDYDAGYYIGLPVSSVYSNTIERMDPYTGALLEKPIDYYLLNTNTNHSAVIFQIFELHPLIEANYTMTIVMCIIFCIALYKAGSFLFKDCYKKMIVFVWFTLLTLFYSYSISGTAHYFAYRPYEGKAICSYFYTVAIFAFFLGIFYEKEKSWGWSGLFFSGVSGIAFCNTALFIIPMMISALVLPMILIQKKWKELRYFIITMIPCIIWLGMHLIL